MRVSKQYGLIFLANPKCASTTVERYIDAYTDGEAVAPAGPRHVGASGLDDYMRAESLDYDDFLVFTTIRNPWDRLVSLWAYAKRRRDSIWYDAATSTESFSEFLHTPIIHNDFVQGFGLHGFTHRTDGKRTVDDVLLVEDYAAALPLMFRRLGIDFVATEMHLNPSVRGDDYRAYYDDADRDLVADLFAADIEYGRYAFDPADRAGTSSSAGAPPCS